MADRAATVECARERTAPIEYVATRPSRVRFIDAATARAHLGYRDALDLVRQGLVAIDAGRIRAPEPRQSLLLLETLGADARFRVVTKPIVVDDHVAIRLAVNGVSGAFDGWRWTMVRRIDGGPVTIVDENETYVVRAAACTAAAVAAISPRATRVGLVGAGRLNRHVPALLRAAGIAMTDVFVTSRDRASALALRDLAGRDVPTAEWHVASGPKEVLAACDVVVVATSADGPLIAATATRAGSLICALGERRELDDALLLTADPLVVDDWALCASAPDLAPLLARGALQRTAVELPAIVAGRRAVRVSDAAPAVYRSRGAAALDAFIAMWLAAKVG